MSSALRIVSWVRFVRFLGEVLLRSRIREHISNNLVKAVWGHWEVIGIGEPTSDQKLRPIVAVRGHCGLGSLFVEQMFKFENLFILVVWIFPLFSILLSLTADYWVRKVCVPSILSLEFSKLRVPLFLMIAALVYYSLPRRPDTGEWQTSRKEGRTGYKHIIYVFILTETLKLIAHLCCTPRLFSLQPVILSRFKTTQSGEIRQFFQ